MNVICSVFAMFVHCLTVTFVGSVSADALDKVVEWKPDHDSIKARWTSHMSARCPVYPNSVLGRCPVPDDRVSWEVTTFAQQKMLNFLPAST